MTDSAKVATTLKIVVDLKTDRAGTVPQLKKDRSSRVFFFFSRSRKNYNHLTHHNIHNWTKALLTDIHCNLCLKYFSKAEGLKERAALFNKNCIN